MLRSVDPPAQPAGSAAQVAVAEPYNSAPIGGRSHSKATKRRWSKPLEWWVSRQLVQGLDLLGRATPRAAPEPLGRALGLLAYGSMRRYRRVALGNLRRAYGDEWDDATIRQVARESFQHLGITLVEFCLRLPRLTLEEAEREVRFSGQEYYEEAFSRGNGVILVSAHFGNWEMIGPRMARAGYTVSGISRTADDPGMERFVGSVRTRFSRQIPRAQAARQGLAALRRNEVLAIMLDQNTQQGGLFVPFFGHPASTAAGPAAFALKTGAALIPTFCIREPDGTHTMKAWPPVYPCPTGDRESDVHRLTSALTQVIELQIRERPELWAWLHNRWKLQPTP